ncbi:YggS family pyridoxal phosphate-dependent enzyme [Candidatus Avelusimicrobium sp.]|uniref:YggS family pyridoxal phosphate-dependent enzyme n=1 Tax=Candidatus Avelusimicrobium sp. TaxID=3048833 RepID=UPI003D7D3E64
MTREEELVKNVQFVESALCAACQKAGRNPQDVTLMAVTKYAQDKDVLTLLAKGLIRHIGESRVQQAEKRWTSPVFAQYKTVKHFIGHLQKNKAAKAARLFDFIDSLDNEETALALNRTAPEGKILRALVQIKLTQKDTQSGLPLNEARALVKKLAGLEHIKICGYMGIAPQGATQEELHRLFKQVKTAFDQDFPGGERYLSLGMSEDFRAAVEEGSTLPRIGSRLFATTLEGL